MYTDPLADYLTRVRNGILANHKICRSSGFQFEKRSNKDPF